MGQLTLLFSLLIAASTIIQITAHGNMVSPINWFDYPQWVKTKHGWKFDYAGMKSKLQCYPGRNLPRELICPKPYDCEGYRAPGGACNWFTNYTFVEKPTLSSPDLRTYPHIKDQTAVMNHPWMAPGEAAVDSPCGSDGGNRKGCDGGPKCGQLQGGFAHGMRAVDVNFQYKFHVTNWARGEVVEVAWGLTANHGGGYSYRLCKMPMEGIIALTEECFQETPLRFVGDHQWLQYGEDKATRITIPAVRTDKGTVPSGSQWTKNPIPACNGIYGGFFDANCTTGTQFKPPAPGAFGYGIGLAQRNRTFSFVIVDKVKIPEELDAGDYVISFRWDCEQSAQVWNTCSSIRLN